MSQLIIPMLVEAYASGNANTNMKKIPRNAPNYKNVMYNSVLGSKNTPGISEVTPALEPGIHLHFVLPDAFTHSPDGVNYPVVPNRFLVTRLWPDNASGKWNTKCFVVESDFISNESKYSTSITIPDFAQPKTKWHYLGRNYPVDKIPEDPAGYLGQLTAVGAGNPLFASYYPDCKSVFGFYDNLKDLPQAASTKLTYYVMGYYSRPEENPFSKVKSQEDFLRQLAEHKFSVTPEAPVCDDCVLYGAIDTIEWKGFNAEYCPSPQGKVNIAFGNTSAEAMSYTIRQYLSQSTELSEKMLTALQYELFDEREELDGNFKIDDAIHFNTYISNDGLDEELTITTHKGEPLEIQIGDEISHLKNLGKEIGSLRRDLVFEQNKLFCIWEQYILLYEEDENTGDKPLKSTVLAELDTICKQVASIKDRIVQKKLEYEAGLTELNGKLPVGAHCKKIGSEVFYSPKDPVILLSGPGINRTYAFGEDGRFTSNGTLFCQTAAITTNIDQSQILTQCFSGLDYIRNLKPVYGDLLLQTSLLCSELKKQLIKVMGSIDIKGTVPSLMAINKDPFNWTTLYMFWGIDYRPTRTAKDIDNTLSDWIYECEDTNLVYKGGLKPLDLKRYPVSGKMLLTPHAVRTFSSIVNRYADNHEQNKDLKELADNIKNLSMVSQNLSGFTEKLLGLWQAFQFPVMGIGEDDEITKNVNQNISEERRSILPDSDLMPMRGGFIKLTDLVLVSSFGQRQKLIESSYRNTCEVGFAETVNCKEEEYGLLPPAFAAPVRINADFISAKDNRIFTSAAPESSPVCGILIPELLNRRLLAYTDSGMYLGMVKTVYRDNKPEARWLSAPNLSTEFDSLNIPNRYLKSFLNELIKKEHAFYEFNRLMDQYLTYKQNYSTLIWGRPLVLTRMKMSFEFFGHPEISKKFQDFQKNNTCGSENIRFQLKIGGMTRATDGVLGSFDNEDFTSMFPPFGAAKPDESQSYVKYMKSLDISNEDKEKYFTLLMEPDSPIHLQTGILPVKTLLLESVHTKTAENLPLTAEISPVLGKTGQVGLPSLPQPEKDMIYNWYIPEKDKYTAGKLAVPITAFEDTALMDGLIVKEKKK